jgi:hypothetical protein
MRKLGRLSHTTAGEIKGQGKHMAGGIRCLAGEGSLPDVSQGIIASIIDKGRWDVPSPAGTGDRRIVREQSDGRNQYQPKCLEGSFHRLEHFLHYLGEGLFLLLWVGL